MRALLILFTFFLTISFANATSGPFPPWITKLSGDVTYSSAGSSSMAVGSVDSAEIATNAVDSAEIAANAVTASELAAGAITEADTFAQSADGLHLKRIVRVTYDVAVDLGTIAAHTLGVSLPANALIQRSWIYVVTQFVDGGSGTVAFHCEDANNIKTATDITGTADGGIIEGAQVGTTATMTGSIAATCEITATVATAEQTAGKAILFVEYVVVE